MAEMLTTVALRLGQYHLFWGAPIVRYIMKTPVKRDTWPLAIKYLPSKTVPLSSSGIADHAIIETVVVREMAHQVDFFWPFLLVFLALFLTVGALAFGRRSLALERAITLEASRAAAAKICALEDDLRGQRQQLSSLDEALANRNNEAEMAMRALAAANEKLIVLEMDLRGQRDQNWILAALLEQSQQDYEADMVMVAHTAADAKMASVGYPNFARAGELKEEFEARVESEKKRANVRRGARQATKDANIFKDGVEAGMRYASKPHGNNSAYTHAIGDTLLAEWKRQRDAAAEQLQEAERKNRVEKERKEARQMNMPLAKGDLKPKDEVSKKTAPPPVAAKAPFNPNASSYQPGRRHQ